MTNIEELEQRLSDKLRALESEQPESIWVGQKEYKGGGSRRWYEAATELNFVQDALGNLRTDYGVFGDAEDAAPMYVVQVEHLGWWVYVSSSYELGGMRLVENALERAGATCRIVRMVQADVVEKRF